MLTRLLALALVLSCFACADDLVHLEPAVTLPTSDTIALIGVSGRELHDGDRYAVPLDYDGVAVPMGVEEREAFVMINTTDRPTLVVSLEVVGAADWSLLAPIRARDVPLVVSGLRVDPGGRIDFDVGFRPEQEGERAATLELVVEQDGVVDARVIELRARCARGPP